MRYVRCASIPIAAILVLAVGCSSNDDAVDAPTTSASSSSQAPTGEGDAGQSDSLTIDVVISNGSVTPTNERFEGYVGETITVNVDSDAADELHVHSVPDHSFDITAANGQSFEFTVDVPGQVALELHDADRTIATLAIRP
ncbi:hypothetical protein [Rhodococcoides kyotonense]|uniref:EfeO-type cupredoxin-like domain-containing protein n=1 Tax=Rhodococcoides kyotonense TaxID=398843 RepID=A0A239JPD9_9NOCA|nr:hypothetical protein [Rhodococcus kyotonensis]SNT07629.1 hypothetical protein SAMN05421642_1094 [Rhodococcus kyotonensis]